MTSKKSRRPETSNRGGLNHWSGLSSREKYLSLPLQERTLGKIRSTEVVSSIILRREKRCVIFCGLPHADDIRESVFLRTADSDQVALPQFFRALLVLCPGINVR